MTSTTPLTPLRYDSPTVTLEVMARAAAVSQWSEKLVVQVLRYRLQIRDASDEAEPVEILGDRTSFLPLIEAVQVYIQAQLTGVEAGGDRPLQGPTLEPCGLTCHTLHLGTLCTTAGASAVTLGAVQLADLGDVLNQLEARVRPLPVPLTVTQQRRPWQQWGAIAAGMVAAVGLTTVLWPSYQLQRTGDTALEAPVAETESADAPAELEESARSPRPEAASEAPRSAVADNAPAASDVAEAESLQSVERLEPASETTPDDAVAGGQSSPPASEETAPQPTQIAPVPSAESPASAPAAPPPAAPAPVPAEPETTPERSAADDSATADVAPSASAAPESAGLTQRAAPRAAPRSLAALVEGMRDAWAPPDDLPQPLTYTLVFAADGTLTDVIPADDIAEQYRDLTGIPAVGTEWLPGGEPQQVQLVLYPDGAVEFQDVAPE